MTLEGFSLTTANFRVCTAHGSTGCGALCIQEKMRSKAGDDSAIVTYLVPKDNFGAHQLGPFHTSALTRVMYTFLRSCEAENEPCVARLPRQSELSPSAESLESPECQEPDQLWTWAPQTVANS